MKPPNNPITTEIIHYKTALVTAINRRGRANAIEAHITGRWVLYCLGGVSYCPLGVILSAGCRTVHWVSYCPLGAVLSRLGAILVSTGCRAVYCLLGAVLSAGCHTGVRWVPPARWVPSLPRP